MQNKIVLSPTSISRFENCPASFIYTNMSDFLPTITNDDVKDFSKIGNIIHQISDTDFSKKKTDEIICNEDKKTINEILLLKETAEKRQYISSEISSTEVHCKCNVRDIGILHGFIDRLTIKDGELNIIDIKTTSWPDYYSDRKQLLGYLFILYHLSRDIEKYTIDNKLDDKNMELLSTKVGLTYDELKKIIDIIGTKPVLLENVNLIIDYIRVNNIYTFKVTEKEFQRHENYLFSVFRRAKEVIDKWKSHNNLNRIVHRPGNCVFCFMKGKCKAYHITIDAEFNETSVNTKPSEELIKEWLYLDDIEHIVSERIKAIKKALLMRNSQSDDTVSKHCTVVSPKIFSYPAEKVINHIVPSIVKKKVKNSKFTTMIDWGDIYDKITDTILRLIPENIDKRDIPSDILDKIDKFKIPINRAKYIKIKK